MCGPSSGAKNLNNQIQAFAGTVQQQASQIFGDASSVFNNLKTSLDKTIQGGPGQQGWGQAEINAVNSQIIDQAAVNNRNIKSSVNSALAASGGGNSVNPSGLEASVNLQTAEATEQAKSQQLQQATVQNFETGRDNYFKAIGDEAQLPNVYNTANTATGLVGGALDSAQKSQSSVDSAKNWWQPLVTGAISSAAGIATGGLTSAAAGGSFWGGASKTEGSGGGEF
jgi:hypothetical protein